MFLNYAIGYFDMFYNPKTGSWQRGFYCLGIFGDNSVCNSFWASMEVKYRDRKIIRLGISPSKYVVDVVNGEFFIWFN